MRNGIEFESEAQAHDFPCVAMDYINELEKNQS